MTHFEEITALVLAANILLEKAANISGKYDTISVELHSALCNLQTSTHYVMLWADNDERMNIFGEELDAAWHRTGKRVGKAEE